MTTDIELRQKFETALRQQAAAQRVNEMLLIHLFARIAGITDDPGEFVRLIMMNIEDSLRKSARAMPEAEHEARQAAQDTIAYFEDLSGRLIAMLTPTATRN